MDKLKTTNTLLLVLVLPVIFYILHLLSFIFVPLIFAMFIALLFMPIMRGMINRNIPKYISLTIVILLILGLMSIIFFIFHVSLKEIIQENGTFLQRANSKITYLLKDIETFLGIEKINSGDVMNLGNINLFKNLGISVNIAMRTLSLFIMSLFFSILILAGTFNFQKILNATLIKQKFTSIKIFRQIEKDLQTFIKVKVIISFFTGLGFTLACYFFDVSFPIFWGFLAFSINFIQMIGSIISVILLSLFAFLEIDSTTTLLFFILSISLVQIIMGSILEPVFMGKTFSINVLTIVIMLLFWGFIWGIPGMILSIPLTVFIKIILEQFPKTKIIADFIS